MIFAGREVSTTLAINRWQNFSRGAMATVRHSFISYRRRLPLSASAILRIEGGDYPGLFTGGG